MFFAEPGIYAPAKLFSIDHCCIASLTLLAIWIAVKNTKCKQKSDIQKIIRKLNIIVWLLEFIRIFYNIKIGCGNNINKVAPLYYCSLLLYAGILSSYATGKLRRMGDVFLATGGIVGGIVFIAFPTTSLPEYPVFHFISVHSFFFHGVMVYLGIIINKFQYIKLQWSDIKYYAIMILCICVMAYNVNMRFGSNLMFISRDFPGTPLEVVYKVSGNLFTPIMVIVQATLPFMISYRNIKKDAR